MNFKIKHRFNSELLFQVETTSFKLCVETAIIQQTDLSGADLSGADLSGAYLSGADLSGADLHGATLHGAYLSGLRTIATLGQPDGWDAYTYLDTKKSEQRIQVGCRNFSIAEAKTYWKGKEHRREVLAIVHYAESIGQLRSWT